MPRNVEIKARARDFARQAELAAEQADEPAVEIRQEDIFFKVPTGRLKLRIFADGTGELIQYHRSDTQEPSQSSYIIAPTSEPGPLRAALDVALGTRAVVRKTRTLLMSGRTRIHLDQVDGLGEFIELEVVLADDEDLAQGVEIAWELMRRLDIRDDDLVEAAYVDLLEGGDEVRPPSSV